MFLNGYSVRIHEGTEKDSYVLMKHKTQYSITLRNTNWTKCNASIEIDGKHQGTWRINAKDFISLDRPAHDTGKFTFYKVNSKEGDSIGLSSEDLNIGLIKVTFTPEKESLPFDDDILETYRSSDYSKSVTFGDSPSRGLSAGGTGLSGRSNQQFGRANQIELDYSKSTTIHLRLVAQEDEDMPRPLTNYSNPVPPPIR